VPGGGTVFELTPSGIETVLYSFCSQTNCADGAYPSAGLIEGSDGNFYGTTAWGGANFDPASDMYIGTVFKITPSGTLTTLYSFCSQAGCADGREPAAGLIQGSDGNFYGTTIVGGANDDGTVFKLTPSGGLTTLHSFCSQTGCVDGSLPRAGLIKGIDGNFYGTTDEGGANDTLYGGAGTVFKITPSGTLTTLYSFCSKGGKACTDGQQPAGLIKGIDGNFYGTTSLGGANRRADGGSGGGTVFKLTPSGAFNILYSFCSESKCADGEFPVAGLIQGIDGNFYGTADLGGANGLGTVFRLTPSGKLTTLYSFCSLTGCTDGRWPSAGVVQGSDGNFYGTTQVGGAQVYGTGGTVFELSPAPRTLSFSPSPVNFGDKTAVGKVGNATVTIKNTSSKESTGDVSINGETAAAPFAVASQCKKTLKPGQTCEVKVTFKPSNVTPQTGNLTVSDNGEDAPQRVPLSGTGK
jgi:uncharacterized repeat protein (TIGR03803 family)